MAGVPGFEPGNAGIKNRCLTAWRYPNKLVFEFAEHIRHIQNLVATTGFEPVTPSLWVMCSNQLSYVAIFFFAIPYRRCGAHYAYRALQRQPLFQGKLLESDCLVRLRTAWRYIRQLLFTLCFFPTLQPFFCHTGWNSEFNNSGGKLIYEILAYSNELSNIDVANPEHFLTAYQNQQAPQ